MGGVFQSQYLPQWQRLTVRLLESLGLSDEADRIRPYDGSGYLCGPMFALFAGDGFAAPAGPAELDAHLIGLSWMLPDLTSRDERPDGWYRSVAEELYSMFPENFLK